MFKARKPTYQNEFVLKKPVRKPTVPVTPKLHTEYRSKLREEYIRKAEEYRKEILAKQREDLEKRKKQKSPDFDLNF